MNYTTRTLCRVCQTTLLPFADLGEHALADKYPLSASDPEEKYPLTIGFCPSCKLVSHQTIVDDTQLFGDDYGFFTGASPSSIAYFERYAKETMERFPDLLDFVIEIASNDGTLLKHFQDAGHKVLGIEPAAPVAQKALHDQIPTLQELFSLNCAFTLPKRGYPLASLILANNVVAHTDKLLDFLSGASLAMRDDGVFIAEVQYFPHLLFNNAFDHLYHEHRSFFSLTSLQMAYRLANLEIFDIQEADTQGGSIRVFAQKSWHGRRPIEDSVKQLLAYEHSIGLNDVATYQGFPSHVAYLKQELHKTLKRLRRERKVVYGFGASAKGATLLQTFEITADLVPYVVDLTPYKIGKVMPGTHQTIIGPDQLPTEPDVYLLLVWNYLEGVLKRNAAFREKGGRFLVPIPHVQLV